MKNFKIFVIEKNNFLDGVASGQTLQDIADKHKVSVEYINQQLKLGIQTELEHTKSKFIAKKIALDHIWEKPDYYTKLKKFVEQAEKTAVITYGRFNPPTIAHEMLINKLSATAKRYNSDAYLIPSHTNFYTAKNKQDKAKNPLTIQEKIKILSETAPSNVIISDQGKTYIDALKYLASQGFTKIIHIAGSDRIPDFKTIIDKYNGKPDKNGVITFNFQQYDFDSAGERDPDSDDLSGMSASKLRKLATEGKYEEFVKGLPTRVQTNFKLSKDIYNIIRERQV